MGIGTIRKIVCVQILNGIWRVLPGLNYVIYIEICFETLAILFAVNCSRTHFAEQIANHARPMAIAEIAREVLLVDTFQSRRAFQYSRSSLIPKNFKVACAVNIYRKRRI